MDEELRDIIIRIDERTKHMAEKLSIVDKRLDSHALEIKDLGRWRFYIMGLGSAVAGYLKFDR